MAGKKGSAGEKPVMFGQGERETEEDIRDVSHEGDDHHHDDDHHDDDHYEDHRDDHGDGNENHNENHNENNNENNNNNDNSDDDDHHDDDHDGDDHDGDDHDDDDHDDDDSDDDDSDDDGDDDDDSDDDGDDDHDGDDHDDDDHDDDDSDDDDEDGDGDDTAEDCDGSVVQPGAGAITGSSSDEVLNGTAGNDQIFGFDGDDVINGGAGNDRLFGGEGDDRVFGGDGNDRLSGGQGNDFVDGGDGNDQLCGGEGDDTLILGAGNDKATGGLGNDTFYVTEGNDVVIGGEDPDGKDIDVLDLTGAGNFTIQMTGPESGIVRFLDDEGNVTGQTVFKEIEKVICFTPGTAIATMQGERAVEELRVGDRVFTRDNGAQEILWIGRKKISLGAGTLPQRLQPILVRKGALGHGLPERDMMVSPSHRLLISGGPAQLYFGESEVLVAAKHLLGMHGIERKATAEVEYIHFLCERHEIVLSNGAWTETFQPGDYSLSGLGQEQREEIFELFPELKDEERVKEGGFAAARRTLKKHEAQLLF